MTGLPSRSGRKTRSQLTYKLLQPMRPRFPHFTYGRTGEGKANRRQAKVRNGTVCVAWPSRQLVELPLRPLKRPRGRLGQHIVILALHLSVVMKLVAI